MAQWQAEAAGNRKARRYCQTARPRLHLSAGIRCNTLHSTLPETSTMSVTTVRLQPEVESSLERMAGKLQRSKNWLVNQAIREFAARQELEQERWNETLAAME